MDANLSEKAMYPIRTKHGYGVSNGTDWVIVPKYKWLQSFYGGYAYAESLEGTKFLIDKSGNEISLIELVRRVCTPDAIEFVNPNNAIDSPGCVVAKNADELLVLSIDHELRVNVVETFGPDCELSPYYGVDWLLIRVKEGGSYCTVMSHPILGRVTLEGIEYVDPPYWECELLAIKEQNDASWAYYDIAARELKRDRYYLAQSFSDGVGLVQQARSLKFEFLDVHLKHVRGLEFEWADVFRHGLAAGTQSGVSGYFDGAGMCRFRSDGDLGRFTRCGHVIIEYEEGHLGIFDHNGTMHIGGLDSCTYYDGDFPFYECERKGDDIVFAGNLKPIRSA